MDKQTLIEDLNGDLAGTLGSIIQHITYAAKADGRYKQRLKQFFIDGIPDEEARARFFAQRIVSLGGEPTTVPRGVLQATTNREMVESLLDSQRQAVHDHAERALEAEEFGDEPLAVTLGDMVREESTHMAKTERVLKDWPL
jgi:bacterioferritin